MRPAPVTFDTKLDANAWLRAQARDVSAGRWTAPTEEVKVGRAPRLRRDVAGISRPQAAHP